MLFTALIVSLGYLYSIPRKIIIGIQSGTVQVFWKLLVSNGVMEILGNICFSEQIFYRKQTMGAPEQ